MPALIRFTAALGLLVVLASPAYAQLDTATVIGTVTDAQGAVLPGATVTATNTTTGFTRSAAADGLGRYRLAALPPGSYEIRAELQGFQAQRRAGLTLALGAESVINFELPLGTVAEAVTITAEVPVVQTTTSAIESRLSRDTLDLLPVIGRDYESLLRLVPGAQSSNGTSFTGSRGRSNQFNIDGVSNSEDISGYSRQALALDSIQEVQVLVNGFKAEFGSASGGVINVVTRSGSNDIRGSGFFLFRDQSLMARSPYADRSLPEDPFQRIHYGGWIGGPLKRDKLHYFVNYEREDRDTNSTSTRTLPAANSNWSQATLRFLQQNNIPLSLFGNGGRIRQVRPEYIDVHNVTAKADAQLSNTQALTLRYQMTHDRQPSGASGTLLDFNGNTAFFRTNYVNANHKWILGANKLNEAYLQIGQSFGDWYASYPGLTNLTITGGFDLGGSTTYPQGRTDWVYQFKNAFSWQLTSTRTGEHALKMGAEIKEFESNSFFDSNFRGTYTFPSLNAFIAGTPSRFTANQGDTRLARPNRIVGFFLQDDWRPNGSLTLNAGVRYDWEGATTEALKDVDGKAGPGISNDKNNVSPRFGFSWAPGGSTTQAFYGGTGIYYDQVILNVIGNARFTPPKVRGIQIDNPAWPDPFQGGTVTLPPPSISVIDPELTTGYNWNSQVGYRREIARDTGLDISYVYNRGYDQIGIINTNLGRPGTANVNGAGAVRPDPRYTNVSFYTNFGEIRYHGLVTSVKRRFSGRLQSEVSYTLSKARDNAFNFVSTLLYPEAPELNWGPNTDDRRHRVTGTADLRLPWNITAGIIAEFRTEAPLNITAARDINGDGSTGEWVNEKVCRTIACPGFNYSRNSVYEVSTEEANRLRALFGLTPIAQFEDNPKYFNVDMTLQWALPFRDTRRARLSVEAFNLLNRPLRNLPTESITSGTFGQITSVTQPRAVQFTLQVDF